ncbi:hypothetical protein U9R62_14665 [Cylindrospermopsis raciborskii DSH]|uniref:hypothetical protein n=1 Tax=Cylindrospermopsis raciborskii TaxID=77022 RepID=UPI002EDB102B
MSLEVNISFRVEGSFTEGFTMTPMIPQQGSQEFRELGSRIRLPACPVLPNLYNECRNFTDEYTRRIEGVPDQTTTVNERERWTRTQMNLNRSFLDWIRNANFEVIINEIITRIFNKRLTDTSVRIHFVSNNSNNNDYDIFRRMPWDEFTRSTRSRMKFVLSQYSLTYNSCPTRLSELRILVIRGGRDLENSQNREINALRKIPGVRLIDKTRTIDNIDCLHKVLTENVYDILFYTGHSSSNNGGEIRVGSLTVSINVFVEDLRMAVSRGLKIALFNSCDGLGIADFLVTQVRVPVVLIMKEPVPDIFAAKFFIEFITRFAADRMSLSIALEKARSSSHFESVNFPGATSLPILFYLYPVKKDFRISRFLYIKVVIYLYIKVVIHKIIKDSFLGVWKKLNNMFGIIQRLSRRQYMYMFIFLLALFSAVVLTIGILKSKNYPLEGVMILPDNIVDIDISDDEQYVAYVDNGGISLQKMDYFIKNYSSLCQINSPSQNGTVILSRLVFKDKETLAIATPKLSNSLALEIRFFNVYKCPKPHEGDPVTIQTEYEYNNNIISLDFSTDKRVILVTTGKEEKNPTTTRLYDSKSGKKIDIQVKDQNGSFNQDSLFNHVVDAKFLDSQKIILLKNKDKNISLEIYKYSPDKNNDNNSWNGKLELDLIHSEPLKTEDPQKPQKIVLSQDRKYISILGPGPIHIWEIDDKFKLKEIPKNIQNQLGGRNDVRDAIFYKKQILIPNTTSVD